MKQLEENEKLFWHKDGTVNCIYKNGEIILCAKRDLLPELKHQIKITKELYGKPIIVKELLESQGSSKSP